MTPIVSLEKWLKDDGAFISEHLQVKDIAGRGRSVITTGPLRAGTKIIEIPRRKLLNFQTLAGDYPSCWNGLTSHQLIALYICVRDPKSEKWSAFIDCLPTWQELSTMPITWQEEKLKDLKGSVCRYVEKQKLKFESDYEAVCNMSTFSSALPAPDRQSFLWAWLCVNTRCIYMSLGLPKESNLTMAPYVDYLNHSDNEEETVNVSITSKSMVVTTTKNYNEAGQEVYLSYGAHDNCFLLCEYGFILHENKWNYLDITEELTHLLNSDQKSVLNDLGYLGEYTINGQGPSFRTEIALACLQEHHITHIPRRLQAMVEGFNDGQTYRAKSHTILRGILKAIKEELVHQRNDVYLGYINIINKNLEHLS